MSSKKLVLFFSGSTSGDSLPERALEKRRPGVMLTYWEIHIGRGDTLKRFQRHATRLQEERNAKD